MPFYVPELTEEEQQLIKENLKFYEALATGRRKPRTDAQRHFVAMCEGKEDPETPHETAYRKYLRIESHRHPQPRNADIPQPSDAGEWCSRRGWKRMRAGQYGDMMKRNRGD